MENCIIAFSTQAEGVSCSDVSSIPTILCCDVYGNQGGDWVGCIADQADTNGNFSADPLFCDTANADFHIDAASPCASVNNSCSTLVGALDVHCGYLYGDADGDANVNIIDAVYIINYLFKEGPAPDPIQAGDVNCDGVIDITDILYLIDYMFRGGPPPC